jgi:AraC-like DNA-binding protein/quercetin dioxygenase-like cupin family protein
LLPPWHREPPTGTTEVATDDDEFLTVETWPREVFQPHYHDEFNWLVLTRPGRMTVQVEAASHVIDAGRWICILPRTPHAVVHVSDDCEVLSLFIPEEAMHRAFVDLGLTGLLEARCIVGGAGIIAQGLALAWGERRFALRDPDLVDQTLEQLVTRWIWRAYRSSVELAPTWAQRARMKLGPLGHELVSFLDEHLADSPFPWDGVSERVAMSRRTLQRRVFEALGVGPSDVLAGMRLDRARELLTEPERPVGDVALACGFSSQSHFSTAFKAEHGVSPAQFRIALSLRQKDLSPRL